MLRAFLCLCQSVLSLRISFGCLSFVDSCCRPHPSSGLLNFKDTGYASCEASAQASGSTALRQRNIQDKRHKLILRSTSVKDKSPAHARIMRHDAQHAVQHSGTTCRTRDKVPEGLRICRRGIRGGLLKQVCEAQAVPERGLQRQARKAQRLYLNVALMGLLSGHLYWKALWYQVSASRDCGFNKP